MWNHSPQWYVASASTEPATPSSYFSPLKDLGGQARTGHPGVHPPSQKVLRKKRSHKYLLVPKTDEKEREREREKGHE